MRTATPTVAVLAPSSSCLEQPPEYHGCIPSSGRRMIRRLPPTTRNGRPFPVASAPQERRRVGDALSTVYTTLKPKGTRLAVPCHVPASVASAPRGGVACERRGYVTTTNGGGGYRDGRADALPRKEHKLSMTANEHLHVVQARARTPRDDVWDSLTAHFGEPRTKTERTMFGRVVAELLEAGATAAETRKACEYVLATFDSPSVNAVPKWFSVAQNGVPRKSAQQIAFDRLREQA